MKEQTDAKPEDAEVRCGIYNGFRKKSKYKKQIQTSYTGDNVLKGFWVTPDQKITFDKLEEDNHTIMFV